MKKETAGMLLALLFILVAGLRIAVALSQPTLTYDGYYPLRLVEHIAEHGTPLHDDPLSYGGRTHLYSPLYYYLLAPFTYLLPSVIVLKFIPNILFAMSILFIYFITNEITRKRSASLFAAALAGLTPITLSQNINDASPLTLSIPLLLLTLYALLNTKRRLALLLVAGVLLTLTSPLILLLLAGLLIYLLVAAAEHLQVEHEHIEALLFLTLFSLWALLLFYKDAFLQQGLSVAWGYLPATLFATYFAEFTIVTAVATIGIYPLLFGGYAAYHALFTTRLKRVIMVASIAAAAALALLLRVTPLRTGMLVLTLMFCILAGQGFKLMLSYFEKTRAPNMKYVLAVLLGLFFLFASALPALSAAADQAADTPSPETLAALNWLHENTPPSVVADDTVDDTSDDTAGSPTIILATPKEGFMIEYVADRAVLIDRDFLLIKNVDTLYDDTEAIFRSRFALPALERLNKHGVTYILFTNEARSMYAREELFFLNECFNTTYVNGTTSIIEVTCDVRTI